MDREQIVHHEPEKFKPDYNSQLYSENKPLLKASWLTVRLSAADLALLKKLAVEAGATVSDLVRGALMPHLVERTA